jgi:hypothetical protein
MNTAKLMQCPLAGEVYAAIDAKTDPGALADLFCQLISHSDYTSQAYALGIESHLRTLATLHFHTTPVRAALDRVEKALALSCKNAQGRKSSRETARNRILANAP